MAYVQHQNPSPNFLCSTNLFVENRLFDTPNEGKNSSRTVHPVTKHLCLSIDLKCSNTAQQLPGLNSTILGRKTPLNCLVKIVVAAYTGTHRRVWINLLLLLQLVLIAVVHLIDREFVKKDVIFLINSSGSEPQTSVK